MSNMNVSMKLTLSDSASATDELLELGRLDVWRPIDARLASAAERNPDQCGPVSVIQARHIVLDIHPVSAIGAYHAIGCGLNAQRTVVIHPNLSP